MRMSGRFSGTYNIDIYAVSMRVDCIDKRYLDDVIDDVDEIRRQTKARKKGFFLICVEIDR